MPKTDNNIRTVTFKEVYILRESWRKKYLEYLSDKDSLGALSYVFKECGQDFNVFKFVMLASGLKNLSSSMSYPEEDKPGVFTMTLNHGDATSSYRMKIVDSYKPEDVLINLDFRTLGETTYPEVIVGLATMLTRLDDVFLKVIKDS